jgi:ribonuclease E
VTEDAPIASANTALPMPATGTDDAQGEAALAVDGIAPAVAGNAEGAVGEGGRRRRGRRGGRRRRRNEDATSAAGLAAGDSVEDFEDEESGEEAPGTGENLGTPLAFTPPAPVSGVPVSAAESDFDDLGIEESAEATQLPPTPVRAESAPLLRTQVELPGVAPAIAPEVSSATANIDTAVDAFAPDATFASVVEALAREATLEPATDVAAAVAPAVVETPYVEPVATPAPAVVANVVAPREPMSAPTPAPAPVETATVTADLFAGRPVEPPAPIAVPPTALVDVAASVATPFDAATRGVEAANGDSVPTADAPVFAATPAEVAAVAVAIDEPTVVALPHDAQDEGPDARSA